MGKENKEKGGYVSAKSNNKVLLFAIAPLILSGLYILSMAFDSEVKIGTFPVISPITQFSVTTLLMLVLVCLLWGFVGYLCAKSKVVFIKSLLICNALPIVMFVVYFVFVIINAETTYKGFEDVMYLIGGLSCNFFSIAGTLFYGLVPINYIEPVVDIVTMLLAFSIGYIAYTQIKKKQEQV